MTNLDSLRKATLTRTEIAQELALTNVTFVQALKAAKAAGATEKELEAATGLTRQRIWQITKEN